MQNIQITRHTAHQSASGSKIKKKVQDVLRTWKTLSVGQRNIVLGIM